MQHLEQIVMAPPKDAEVVASSETAEAEVEAPKETAASPPTDANDSAELAATGGEGIEAKAPSQVKR